MKQPRVIDLEIKMAGDADDNSGVFVGYGSKYGNVDFANDIMAPGVFAKSINDREAKGESFPILWQHNSHEPIGRIKQISEDNGGMRIVAELDLNVQKAREAQSLIRNGIIKGLSVGFNIVNQKKDGNRRIITEAKLWEVSVVTFPCNELATIDFIKSVHQGVVKAIQDEAAAAGDSDEDEAVTPPAGPADPEQPTKRSVREILDELLAADLPNTLSKEDWVFLTEDLDTLLTDAERTVELDLEVNGEDPTSETETSVGDEAVSDSNESTSDEPQDITDEQLNKFMSMLSTHKA